MPPHGHRAITHPRGTRIAAHTPGVCKAIRHQGVDAAVTRTGAAHQIWISPSAALDIALLSKLIH
jgi:hypothetical protein